MIEFETKKPTIDRPDAAFYGFAKKHGIGDDDAERILLKIGSLASEEDFLAEAKLVFPNRKMPNTKARRL